MSFATSRLSSFNEMRPLGRGWLYRGQRSVKWPLETSLERCCNREGIGWDQRQLFETNLIRQFRRAYHQFSVHVPETDDPLEWLSLMQHHGAPTRLLDFTYSVYTAAYFALENASKEDCVVWAVNGRWALNESVRLMKNAGKKNADVLKHLYKEEHKGVFREFFLDDPAVPCASPQNPFRLNERLRIQSGVFLIPGSIAMSFEENLLAMCDPKGPPNIFKVVIPYSCRRQALRQLFDMNISRTSLFPGLDGYAETLRVYHPAYEEPWSEEAT